MIVFDPSFDAPATVRYHRAEIEQIVQSVEDRVYCAVLGPRLCGKTLLLKFIERDLSRLLGWTCMYIDLLDLRATTQRAFFSDLIRLTAQHILAATGVEVPTPDEYSASSAMFRAFLGECLEATGRDLVLIFDPLEAMPTDLVQALLTSLRAAYMDQQGLDGQVTVIVSGALSLATLTVGESSPFRGIAQRVFIGDLSRDSSRELILEFLTGHGVSATRPAVTRFLEATSGDIYLINRISQCCADHVQSRSDRTLRAPHVTSIVDRFLRQEVYNYAPLVEAVRLIEEDPDLLNCILKLLEHERLPRVALPLPLSPDLDPLYLTGVVDRDSDDSYHIQNEIYRRFLLAHFTPDRVGYVLSMVGYWDSAIDYLEASVMQGNRKSRSELLPAVINSMYAAQDLMGAVHFLQRGLSAAFGIHQSQVWVKPIYERTMELISPREEAGTQNGLDTQRISLNADLIETRAFRQRVAVRDLDGEQTVRRAIPLKVPGHKAIGVVTILDDLVNDLFNDPRERDLELTGFLNQSARALEAVGTRRQELAFAGRVQASLLPASAPNYPGWQIAAYWQPARETAGDFYDFIPLPGDRLGIVIADVVDKGMGPALLMTLSRTLIRTFAEDYTEDPDRLLAVTNQRIIQDLTAGMFVTLFYGVLDPETGILVYSNAGHPPPYLQAGPDVSPLYRTGMALGVSQDVAWAQESLQIPPGAALVLYTDGVVDAQNDAAQLYGSDQLQRFLQDHPGSSAQNIQDSLLAEIQAFSGPGPRADDITLVVLVHEA